MPLLSWTSKNHSECTKSSSNGRICGTPSPALAEARAPSQRRGYRASLFSVWVCNASAFEEQNILLKARNSGSAEMAVDPAK